MPAARGSTAIAASHATLGERWLYVEGDVPLLFTENDTNHQRLFGTANAGPFVKDAFHEHVVHGNPDAVNPARTGTKAAAHRIVEIGPGQTAVMKLRLCDVAPASLKDPFAGFDATFAARLAEADAFYASLTPPKATEDEARVMRQALAGMLWSKQYYFFDAEKWLEEHHVDLVVEERPVVLGSPRQVEHRSPLRAFHLEHVLTPVEQEARRERVAHRVTGSTRLTTQGCKRPSDFNGGVNSFHRSQFEQTFTDGLRVVVA